MEASVLRRDRHAEGAHLGHPTNHVLGRIQVVAMDLGGNWENSLIGEPAKHLCDQGHILGEVTRTRSPFSHPCGNLFQHLRRRSVSQEPVHFASPEIVGDRVAVASSPRRADQVRRGDPRKKALHLPVAGVGSERSDSGRLRREEREAIGGVLMQVEEFVRHTPIPHAEPRKRPRVRFDGGLHAVGGCVQHH